MPKWAVIKAYLFHWYKLSLHWFGSRLQTTCRKERLTYLDQNALIGLGLRVHKDALLRDRLYKRIGNASLRVVVSPWHLVETAHTANIHSATRLAEFIDSLMPQWIHERRELQKLDVQDDFYRFCKMDFEPTPRITSKAAVIGALFGDGPLTKYEIPSSDFVKHWIEHPEQLRTMKKSFQSEAEAILKIRDLVTNGKLTQAIQQEASRRWFELSMPKVTPAGLEITRETKAAYIAQARVNAIPTFAVEHAISVHEWSQDAVGRVDSNTLVDKVHLISALPFVDEIITTDPFFSAIYPAARVSGHVKALLVSNEEFMSRL